VSSAVRISDELMREAKLMSSVENRSATGQIEYWAKMGKCAEENPDLTFTLIREILIGLEELDRNESTGYEFG